VTDGIGILVLSALAEVELDVAFHVLRRFSAGAGAVQKVWKYRQRLARTTLSASLGAERKKKYQDFLSWRGVRSPCNSRRGCAALDGKPIHDLSSGVRRSSKSLVSPCPAGQGRKSR
jgi:hypothetical protein